MRAMVRFFLGAAAIVSALGGGDEALATCTLPNNITNGTTADATQVMGDFNAVTTCINNAPAGSTNSVQINAGSGNFGGIGPLTNGQIIIGSTGAAPQAATLTAGPNVTITNSAGSITIAASAIGGNPFESTPTKPTASSFTLQNAGTASMADGTFGIVLTVPSSSMNVRFMKYNAGLPGSSWSLIMRSSTITPLDTTYVHHGAVILRDSTSGKIVLFSTSGGTTVIQRWNNYTSYNTTTVSLSTYAGQMLYWKKVTSDGTTLRFYQSPNGADWGLIGSEAISSFLGSFNEVGIGMVNGAATGSVDNLDVFESFTLN